MPDRYSGLNAGFPALNPPDKTARTLISEKACGSPNSMK